VLRTGKTLVINEDVQGTAKKFGAYRLAGSTPAKSEVFVPLFASGKVRGLINLIDLEREHAFGESDVRLLQTLAASMAVALENARLFDETQRRTREAAALAKSAATSPRPSTSRR
jgi:GAF domain-containing protein